MTEDKKVSNDAKAQLEARDQLWDALIKMGASRVTIDRDSVRFRYHAKDFVIRKENLIVTCSE